MTSITDKAYLPHNATANLPHDAVGHLRHSSGMEPIDFLIQRVAERLIAIDRTERQVSLEATGSPDALRYIRTRRAMPSPPRLRAIANELGTSEDYLLGRTDRSVAPSRPLTAGDLLGDAELIAKQMVEDQERDRKRNADLRNRRVDLPEDVPVYSADLKFDVVGDSSNEEWHIAEAMQITLVVSIDTFKRLPKLYQAEHVYGFYVPGISMSPLFEAGSPVLVDGKRSPVPGDFTLVYLADDPEAQPYFAQTCMLKRLVRSTSEWHEFEEFNPPRRFKVQRDQIDYMHRVYTLGDFLR